MEKAKKITSFDDVDIACKLNDESKKERFIKEYLVDQQVNVKMKIDELKSHLIEYPEDKFSQKELQKYFERLYFLNEMSRSIYNGSY